MQVLTALFIGLLFGAGILVSGMSNPAKVLNFFDVTGHWDPSLAFVMAGALAVTFIGYRWVLGQRRPVLGEAFQLPVAQALDKRLVAGSLLFGAGWGVAGFCPGGLLPVLAVGRAEPLIFAAGLAGGLVIARLWLSRALRRKSGRVTA